MMNVKTPQDILNYMDNIDYGYIDLSDVKHINCLPNLRREYRTLDISQILEYRIGTCIEQVLLMHVLLDSINIKNKMFCTRVYESGEIDLDKEEHLHCFILYYDDEGVHHLEHPNRDRIGIYDYKDEETAITDINRIHIERAGGLVRMVTEFYDVEPGLTFKQFNDYINSLDEYNK